MTIEYTITDSDIEWSMDWPERDQETIFEREKALALLLINEVIFLNSFWNENGWPDKAKQSINVLVDCNDVFAWGTADCERLPHKEIKNLYRMWRKDPSWGAAIWCMIQRREMPQKPVEKLIREAGIWDLDSLGLDSNTTDALVQDWIRAAIYQHKIENEYNWSA